MNKQDEEALVTFAISVTEALKNMALAMEALKERIELIEATFLSSNRMN